MEPIIALRVTKTLAGLIGIFGNGLVCIVIFLVKSMHTTTNMFIFNQAVMDFLGCLLLLLSSNVPVPDPLPPGLAGTLLCHLWISDSIVWLLYSASTINLAMLTFERYFAIVFPFKYGPLFCYKKSVPVCMLIFAWLMGFLVAVYGSAIFAPVDDHCISVNIPGGNVLGILIIGIYYFIPILFMIFAYIHISIELKRSSNRVVPVIGRTAADDRSEAPAAPQQDDPIKRARINTYKTLLVVVGAYIICWTPNEIIFLLFNLGWLYLDFSGALYIVSVALVAINSCINPVIYAFKYKQFQKAVMQVFFRRRPTANSVATVETELRG
ncbi:alpha-1A adrenergic receptor-like [Asterias amurensis]|uniref:alpha-1A adrenergic receptor-like n=1 Tax=Asterias amurensis TaxID=7602 RepID=UPI003AB56B6F